MPQMKPLNWLYLFILFSLIIMMINMLNYYNNNNNNKIYNLKKNSHLNLNLNFWKW